MKIKFLSPVNHDLIEYVEGDTLDLPAAQARALIGVGAAEETTLPAKKPASNAKQKGDKAEGEGTEE